MGALSAPSGPNADLRSLVRVPSRLSPRGPAGTEPLTWTAGGDPTAGAVHIALHVQASRQTAMDIMHFLGL
jgi:hypothetical protein